MVLVISFRIILPTIRGPLLGSVLAFNLQQKEVLSKSLNSSNSKYRTIKNEIFCNLLFNYWSSIDTCSLQSRRHSKSFIASLQTTLMIVILFLVINCRQSSKPKKVSAGQFMTGAHKSEITSTSWTNPHQNLATESFNSELSFSSRIIELGNYVPGPPFHIISNPGFNQESIKHHQPINKAKNTFWWV